MAERSGRAGLEAALDALAARNGAVRLWLRDDDATAASPALARLLDIAEAADAGPLIAAIPAHAEPGLARMIEGRGARLAVHGHAHANHAPAGAKRSELGPDRPTDEVIAELAGARERLAGLAGDLLLPVLVPPWNRIAPEVVARLGEAGYTGLSTFGRRAGEWAAPGIVEVNTHLDLIDWRGTRAGRPHGALFATLAGMLDVDAAELGEPIGILTHHRVHDDNAWAFLEALIAATRGHPAVCWADAGALFAAAAN